MNESQISSYSSQLSGSTQANRIVESSTSIDLSYLSSIADLITALSHFAWPVVMLFFLIYYRKSINKILSKVTKLKIFGQEFELDEEIDQLEQEVKQASEAIPPQKTPETKIKIQQEQEVIEEIMNVASKTPITAIMLLASEIERTAREVLAGSGWLHKLQSTNVRENLRLLIKQNRIPESIYSSFNLFWEIRNKVVHGVGTKDIPKQELMQIIDIGLTLLKTINSIPRERHYVKFTDVDIFSDEKCKNKREGVKGIILSNISPGGLNERKSIFPITRFGYYKKGKEVSWEWSNYNKWDDTWYIDPETKEKRLAWNSSLEFTGRHMEELGNK